MDRLPVVRPIPRQDGTLWGSEAGEAVELKKSRGGCGLAQGEAQRVASEAQVSANRRNARRSTGPRTAAGQASSSQNAVSHGLFAREALMPGEDAAQFRRFARAMAFPAFP